MKQKPWAEDIENAIDKARKDGSDEAMASIDKALTKVYSLASEIMNLTAGWKPPKGNSTTLQDKPAPKRGPVTATPQQVFDVHDALVQLHGAAVSIKNLRGATGVGPKIIGSALRALITVGSVVEGPRGKFKAVQPKVEVEADGKVDSTDSAAG